jgi:hypothetical protein
LYMASFGQNIKLFILKTPSFSVSHGSKPAYSLPMICL